MKRIITLSLLAALYGLGSVQTASAIYCSNCSTIVQQFIQIAKETISAGADVATQVNTLLLRNKELVLDPLQNALIAASLLSQQSNTINFVTGGLGGPALLQVNPEQWIKNQGLNTVKISITDIQGSKGLYSSSLLSSVINSYRGSSDLKGTLESLSKSSIPSATQTEICKEANLTALAKNQALRSDGTYDTLAFNQAKTAIYNQYCRGSPSSDKQLEARLYQLANQRTDLTGLNMILLRAGEDNAYARSVRATIAIAQDEEAKKNAARDDINRGGGIVSPSVCKETVSDPNNQNIANLPCRVRELTGSGAAVSGSFQQALNAPIQKLIQADGWGILGTLSQLLAAKNTIDRMKNSFASVNVSLGGSTGGSTNTTSRSTTQDLLNNQSGKQTVSEPVLSRLAEYSESLSRLDAADTKILTQIAIAEGQINSVKVCYQSLVDEFSLSPADYRVEPGFTYASRRANSLSSLRSQVLADQSKIRAGQSAVEELRTKIAMSNSSQDISNLYEAFEQRITNGSLPNESLGIVREGDAQSLEGENEAAKQEGGDVSTLKNQCQSLRSQLSMQGGA